MPLFFIQGREKLSGRLMAFTRHATLGKRVGVQQETVARSVMRRRPSLATPAQTDTFLHFRQKGRADSKGKNETGQTEGKESEETLKNDNTDPISLHFVRQPPLHHVQQYPTTPKQHHSTSLLSANGFDAPTRGAATTLWSRRHTTRRRRRCSGTAARRSRIRHPIRRGRRCNRRR